MHESSSDQCARQHQVVPCWLCTAQAYISLWYAGSPLDAYACYVRSTLGLIVSRSLGLSPLRDTAYKAPSTSCAYVDPPDIPDNDAVHVHVARKG